MYTLALCALALYVLRPTFSFPIPVRDLNTPTAVSTPPNTAKFVFAHHIIGNTFNFTPVTWTRDVQLAHASGIDGFALNIGNSPWEIGQVQSAYDAAEKSGTGFKMFMSLDMSALPCVSSSDAQKLVSLIRNQASHPSQFRFGPDNKSFVSTFSGEKCTFSAASPSEGWAQHFATPLATEIHFVPAFFVDPTQLSTGDARGNDGFGGVTDGDFNWNSGWPIQLTTAALAKSASNPSALASLLNTNVSSLCSIISSPNPNTSLTSVVSGSTPYIPPTSFAELTSVFDSPDGITDTARAAFASVTGAFTTDRQHINAIQNRNVGSGALGVTNVAGAIVSAPPPVHKTYMAAVSPWFFTHFSPSSFNKNFIYLSDNHLYSKRWETLVASRETVDLVEIATWNDFGESHYIGPIEGMQPNSQAWVNGNDHTGWLELTAYYARAFKSGVYPTISRDKVVMWARTHPRDAQASEDIVGRPKNFQLTEDSLWATVFVPATSTVTLTTSLNLTSPSSSTKTKNNSSSSVNFQVPAGVSHLKVPLTPGGGMAASVSRGGQTVLDFVPKGYIFDPNPKTFNFNAFVAASP